MCARSRPSADSTADSAMESQSESVLNRDSLASLGPAKDFTAGIGIAAGGLEALIPALFSLWVAHFRPPNRSGFTFDRKPRFRMRLPIRTFK